MLTIFLSITLSFAVAQADQKRDPGLETAGIWRMSAKLRASAGPCGGSRSEYREAASVKPRIKSRANMCGSSKGRLLSSRLRVILGSLLFLAAAMAAYAPTAQPQSISTYHYDNLRTGWNPNETVLTPQNVPGLQLLASVSLDEQVDAQPLLVRGLTIAGGTHDVLYVATENNTVYALDAASGAHLLTRHLGRPVPLSALPGQCNNNSANVGITSTPVIDLTSSTIYVMVYTYANHVSSYLLHALDLATLQDKVTAKVVSASAELSNGNVYKFNPAASRQRSGLLEANGNIYAGFASFCDNKANLSRGWLLGWNARLLTPLAADQLDDQLATSDDNFFLSSIWMSGYGVAADSSGNLYFSTGNSDYSGTSYDTTYNLSESVVKISPDLTKVESYFTPSDSSFGVTILDQQDADTGSGGVLLFPDQPGFTAGLATAAGKAGEMYLLNRSNLGGYNSNGTNNVLGTYSIGGDCHCGESYFQGWDANGRVVSSGGNNIIVWQVQTSPAPALIQESMSPTLASGQDGGFFTSVSSNGTQNPIIWAVGHPYDNTANVTLYAFDPLAASRGSSSWLFSAVAGTWPNTQGNANIVPVVANGRVYVASYRQLAIFGLGSGAAAPLAAQFVQQSSPQIAQVASQDSAHLPPNGHEIFGTITTINGDLITVETRNGALVDVDATEAVESYQSVVLLVDKTVRMLGSYNASNVFQATVITRAKASAKLWPPDR